MSGKKDKKVQVDLKRHTNYSEEFKRSKVRDLAQKKIRVCELSKLYGLSKSSIYKWIYLYSDTPRGTKTVVEMDSEYMRTQSLLHKVAELERLLGQKQVEIAYLEKGYELLSEEYGFDVKKKYVPERLSGLEPPKSNINSK